MFDAGPVWIVVPPVEGADDLRSLLELEATEMEVELGSPVIVNDDPPSGARTLVIEIDETVSVPRLVREGPAIVRVLGRSLGDCESALSLLRTMRRTDGASLSWEPTADAAASIDVVFREIATTWPSFGWTGIDWIDLSDRYGPDASDPAEDVIIALQRWVAQLADGHTNVHARTDIAALPYAARVIDDRLVIADVLEGTVAWEAGVRAGDELFDIDVAEIGGRAGAPSHLHPWLVGRRALSGPVAAPIRFGVRRSDASTLSFVDTPGVSTWPAPIEFRRLTSGTAYLRIRRWLSTDEDLVDVALGELRPSDRLLVDLRGNAGGSLIAAASFRRRFLSEPTRLGSVRYSVGDGTLAPHSYYDEGPSPRVGWLGRIRFLTDALTYSASEDAILGLGQLPRIDVVGQPSGGGSGRVRRIALHGTAVLTVSTAVTYDHLGRCIEGAGIAVDRQLPDDERMVELADQDW